VVNGNQLLRIQPIDHVAAPAIRAEDASIHTAPWELSSRVMLGSGEIVHGFGWESLVLEARIHRLHSPKPAVMRTNPHQHQNSERRPDFTRQPVIEDSHA